MTLCSGGLLKKYLGISIVFIVALVVFSFAGRSISFTSYQARDIQRALDLLNGSFIWFGPDLTGGGHTPGPFYYYLLAIPLGIFGSWQSIVWFQCLLTAMSTSILWAFMKRHHGLIAANLLVYFFLSSSILETCYLQFWNPSFLFLFQVLLIVILHDYRQMNYVSVALAGLVLGLSVQIHYIQIIFFFGILLTIATDKKIANRKKILQILTISFSSLLPQVPYLLTLSNGEARGISFDGAFGSVIRLVSFTSTDSLLKGIKWFLSDALINEFNFFISLGIWIALAFTILFKRERNVELNRFLVISLGVASFFVLPNFFEPFFLRYSMPFFILFYVLSAPAVAEFFKRWSPAAPRRVLCAFVIVGVLQFLWKYFDTQVDYTIESGYKFSRNLDGRDDLMSALLAETGWTWDYLRERAFIAGKGPEYDYSTMYKLAWRKSRPQVSPAQYDGLIAIFDVLAKFLKKNGEPNWNAIRKLIPAEIYEAARSGELICNKTIHVGGFQVCFYDVLDSTSKVAWNNLGHPYQTQPLPLTVPLESRVGAKRSNGVWAFHWNACDRFENTCTVLFLVKKIGESLAEFQAFGDPIAVAEWAMSPILSLSLRDIEVETECEKGRFVQRVTSHLGFSTRNEGYGEPAFLAPYSRQIKLGCAKPKRMVLKGTVERSYLSGREHKVLFPRLEWVVRASLIP